MKNEDSKFSKVMRKKITPLYAWVSIAVISLIVLFIFATYFSIGAGVNVLEKLFNIPALLVVLFLVIVTAVICMAYVASNRETNKKNEAAQKEQPCNTAEEIVKQDSEAQKVEQVAEVAVAAEVADETTEEDEITFAVGTNKTLDDKYNALEADAKKYYDTIVSYVSEKPDIKHFKNVSYEEYKIRTSRIVRLAIRRGVVNCQFILLNSDFQQYLNNNKVSAKQAPVTIKLVDEESVNAAKNCIDIAIKSHYEMAEYKKQLQREKRRKTRMEKE